MFYVSDAACGQVCRRRPVVPRVYYWEFDVLHESRNVWVFQIHSPPHRVHAVAHVEHKTVLSTFHRVLHVRQYIHHLKHIFSHDRHVVNRLIQRRRTGGAYFTCVVSQSGSSICISVQCTAMSGTATSLSMTQYMRDVISRVLAASGGGVLPGKSVECRLFTYSSG